MEDEIYSDWRGVISIYAPGCDNDKSGHLNIATVSFLPATIKKRIKVDLIFRTLQGIIPLARNF